jgi:hypothetical protein
MTTIIIIITFMMISKLILVPLLHQILKMRTIPMWPSAYDQRDVCRYSLNYKKYNKFPEFGKWILKMNIFQKSPSLYEKLRYKQTVTSKQKLEQ